MRKISRFQYAKWNSTPVERSFGKLVGSIGPSLSGLRPVSSRRLINIDGAVAPALMRQRRRNENEAVTCPTLWFHAKMINFHPRGFSWLFTFDSRPSYTSPIIGLARLACPSRAVNWTITTGWTSENRVTSHRLIENHSSQPRGPRPRSINKRWIWNEKEREIGINNATSTTRCKKNIYPFNILQQEELRHSFRVNDRFNRISI